MIFRMMDPKGGKSWISLVLKAFLLSTKNYFVIVMKSAHKMLYKSVHGVVCASAHTLGTFRQSRSLKNCNKNRKKIIISDAFSIPLFHISFTRSLSSARVSAFIFLFIINVVVVVVKVVHSIKFARRFPSFIFI